MITLENYLLKKEKGGKRRAKKELVHSGKRGTSDLDKKKPMQAIKEKATMLDV